MFFSNLDSVATLIQDDILTQNTNAWNRTHNIFFRLDHAITGYELQGLDVNTEEANKQAITNHTWSYIELQIEEAKV